MDIYGDQYVSFIFLWKDQIPEKMIEQYNMDLGQHYVLTGNIEPVSPTPSFYLVDSSGEIIYYNSSAELVMEKLYTLNLDIYQNGEELKKLACNYLYTNFCDTESEKIQVIYFKMDGCPDCAAADEVILESDILETYEINEIYKYDDVNETHIKDTYGIFKQILSISWYPTFLCFESIEEPRMIGECPIDNIIENIRGN